MTQPAIRVGDIVSYISKSGNGSGEGILWIVKKASKPDRHGHMILLIEPCFTLTGPSVRRGVKIGSYAVTLMTSTMLMVEYQRLGELAERQLAHECGVETV